MIAKLQKHLGSLVGKEIALLGLAFKPNTDDMREASSLVLSARLQAAGARVRAYDPVAEAEARKLIRGVTSAPARRRRSRGPTRSCSSPSGRSSASWTWPSIAGRMRGDLVIDGRNFLDADAVREAGLHYEAVGRPARSGRAQADPSRPGTAPRSDPPRRAGADPGRR